MSDCIRVHRPDGRAIDLVGQHIVGIEEIEGAEAGCFIHLTTGQALRVQESRADVQALRSCL